MATPLDPPGLVGRWDLSRVITDRLAEERSQVTGTSEFTREPDGRIKWLDSGTWRRHGVDLPVHRVLFLQRRGPRWFVTFEDGRDFHPWEPEGPVEHLCAADTYAGVIRRLDDDGWTVEWRVSGPSKDYTMTSVLTRSARRACTSSG